MPSKEQLAYCSGLFDGEGTVLIKQYFERGYWRWRIQMEVAMVEREVIVFFQQTVGVGTVHSKVNKGFGKKLQWRWRAGHQKALRVAELLIPYSKVKYPKLRQVVEHYGNKKFKAQHLTTDCYQANFLGHPGT
tara:strand:+ start:333 stop:731 length:399 start_codon:yes stop_codon:yes gene_type:complete